MKEHTIDLGYDRYLIINWEGGWDADNEPGNHLWHADVHAVFYDDGYYITEITYLTELFWPKMDQWIDEALRENKTHA
jgi:hypothetical protein